MEQSPEASAWLPEPALQVPAGLVNAPAPIPGGQIPCAPQSLPHCLWLRLEVGSYSFQQPQNDAIFTKRRAEEAEVNVLSLLH